MRELIYQSIRRYVDFIKHFKKDSYPKPAEVLAREYDADTPFEESFITVKLDIEGTSIVFADDLEEKVQPELENIIDAIVKQSHNLPRPENTIARGDKAHLWTVPDDDEVAEDAKRTISAIIEENRTVVEEALHVYDDYMWILSEGDRVKEFLKIEPKVRKDYQAQVDKYAQTIDEIRLKMPFELRMNMFLVECKDLNDMLCGRLTELMAMVLDNASEHVFSKLCTQIQADVKQIKDDLQQRAAQSKVLVEYEKRLEQLQNEDQKRIRAEYGDMIQWHQMLCKNPIHKLSDQEHTRPIIGAYTSVNDIVNIVENSTGRLKVDRKEIEDRLISEVEDYGARMKELKMKVMALAQPESAEIADVARGQLNKILEMIANLKDCKKKLKSIQEQQADLELMVTEDGSCEQLLTDVDPHRQLWELVVEQRAKADIWQKRPLKEQNPEEAEADYRRFRSQAAKLQNQFEQKKSSMAKCTDIAKGLVRKIAGLKDVIPLIRALCNPGLNDRHKKMIFAALGGAEAGQDLADMRMTELQSGMQITKHR